MSRPVVLAAAVAVVIMLVPARARAQGNTASLGGAVRDEQQLPAPGAMVTIAARDSPLTRTVTAGPDGGFEFPYVINLSPDSIREFQIQTGRQ